MGNEYLRKAPCLAVDPPRLEDKPPGILTPEQCAAQLHCCRESEPALLPTLALCLFAGIRPEEARRLTWADIGPEFVNIPAAKAKTRQRRLVTITPQLRDWLDLGRQLGGLLPVSNYSNRFNRVRRLDKLFDGWPPDAMRHIFASYHYAKHRNENTKTRPPPKWATRRK